MLQRFVVFTMLVTDYHAAMHLCMQRTCSMTTALVTLGS
nr:MAG TPA: hypothetical protein [Bacteriophage sp.]